MPEDVTAQLMAAPCIEDFLGYRGLYVDASVAVPVVKVTAKDSLSTVYGPDRLFWINVYRDWNENRFTAVLTTAPNPSSVLCYWLPWRQDGTVRIRLRKSKKYGAALKGAHVQAEKVDGSSAIVPGSTAGAAITRPEVNIQNAPEPRLFLTAFMDGCSTWVAGDPTEPIVYHINRAASSHESFVKFGKINDLYDREAKVHKANTKKMTGDFKEAWKMEGSGDRLQRSDSRFSSTAVVGVGVTPEGHKMHHMGDQKWSAQMQAHTGLQGNLKVLKQLTSMFGVKRADGGWSFYSQDLYQFKHLDVSGNALGNPLYIAGRPRKAFPVH